MPNRHSLPKEQSNRTAGFAARGYGIEGWFAAGVVIARRMPFSRRKLGASSVVASVAVSAAVSDRKLPVGLSILATMLRQ